MKICVPAVVGERSPKPTVVVSTATTIDWVRGDDLVFPSGSRHEYSNTENIIVGLIAEQVTGEGYRDLLSGRVFAPARL